MNQMLFLFCLILFPGMSSGLSNKMPEESDPTMITSPLLFFYQANPHLEENLRVHLPEAPASESFFDLLIAGMKDKKLSEEHRTTVREMFKQNLVDDRVFREVTSLPFSTDDTWSVYDKVSKEGRCGGNRTSDFLPRVGNSVSGMTTWSRALTVDVMLDFSNGRKERALKNHITYLKFLQRYSECAESAVQWSLSSTWLKQYILNINRLKSQEKQFKAATGEVTKWFHRINQEEVLKRIILSESFSLFPLIYHPGFSNNYLGSMSEYQEGWMKHFRTKSMKLKIYRSFAENVYRQEEDRRGDLAHFITYVVGDIDPVNTIAADIEIYSEGLKKLNVSSALSAVRAMQSKIAQDVFEQLNLELHGIESPSLLLDEKFLAQYAESLVNDPVKTKSLRMRATQTKLHIRKALLLLFLKLSESRMTEFETKFKLKNEELAKLLNQ